MKFNVGDYAIFNTKSIKSNNDGIVRITKIHQHFDQYFLLIWFFKYNRDSHVFFEEDDLIKIDPPSKLLKILLDIQEK